MSNRKDKDQDRVAACEELLEEAEVEDGDAGELEQSEEPDRGEHYASFLRPMRGKKAWIILAAILVVIAVGVLYVYQAGDKKTILGNQPIPAGLLDARGSPMAAGTGGTPGWPVARSVPAGGGMQIDRIVPSPSQGGAERTVVGCPQCGMKGLAVCSSCGAVMRPLGNGSGLFACPSCGSVGIPICPHDGTHMSAPGGSGIRPVAGTAGITGGQFQCPACGATGLPNWDPAGAPICPGCGARMTVRAAGNQGLVAAPWPGG